MSIVKLLGGSRELGEFDGDQGCCWLCGLRDAADVVPRVECAGALGAIIGCRHQVAGQEEEVVGKPATKAPTQVPSRG
jgi:hypothetical protein